MLLVIAVTRVAKRLGPIFASARRSGTRAKSRPRVGVFFITTEGMRLIVNLGRAYVLTLRTRRGLSCSSLVLP